MSTFAALILIVALLSGCGNNDKKEAGVQSQSPKPNSIAATYKDGGKVTQAELASFIGALSFVNQQYAQSKDVPEFKEYALKQVVLSKVLVARASEANKKAADAKVKEQMDQINKLDKQQKEDLDKRFKDAGITLADIESYIRSNEILMLDATSKVTDQQIKEKYENKLKEDPIAFDIATVSHILFALKDPTDQSGQKVLRTKEEALKLAKEVKDKLTAGGDFAALAKQYSDDGGSKENGGKYENQSLSQWVPEFKKAAGTLPLNTISDPVETQFGYHIMKVESRSTKTLAEETTKLRQELAETQINQFMEKEFPSLEFKSNLPVISPSPEASIAPAASPAASVQPSPVK